MLKQLTILLISGAMLAACNSNSARYIDNQHQLTNHLNEFEKTVGDRVFFALDSSSLSSDAKKSLDKQATWLQNHNAFSITVEGHCDERGTREYNIALGEKRAQAAKNYLVKQGVSASRIETISYGKERPAVIGNNEISWSQNRRAVTAIK